MHCHRNRHLNHHLRISSSRCPAGLVEEASFEAPVDVEEAVDLVEVAAVECQVESDFPAAWARRCRNSSCFDPTLTSSIVSRNSHRIPTPQAWPPSSLPPTCCGSVAPTRQSITFPRPCRM